MLKFHALIIRRLGCRSYRYLHLKDKEEVRQTNKDDEAAREEGVPLQWSIATKSSNSSTFMVNLIPQILRLSCPLQPRPLLGEHHLSVM